MNEKGPLIDLIIHDLTGPLSVVSTSVEGLLRKDSRHGPVSDRQKQALERILRNSRKAQRLLQEMIEVYRSEEGLFRKEHFLIIDVLKEALLDAIETLDPDKADVLARTGCYEDFTAVLKGYGISVSVEGRYSSSPFCHDQKKLQQILRNLISNALKFRNKEVRVSIHGDRDLLVSVEDDGSGIPKEKQGHIFKRFFQTRNSSDANAQKGLGFGLSCVKTLVETMNGGITLLSGEGEGTCFTVSIPPLEMNNGKEEVT
jgi:two-component system phosphate regulon sensor histidine kinase PhoR